jgi:hypothetical protein
MRVLAVSVVRNGRILEMFLRCRWQERERDWIWGVKDRSESSITPRQRACCLGVMVVPHTEMERLGLGTVSVDGEKTRSSVLERFSLRYKEDMMSETAERQSLVFCRSAGVMLEEEV